MSVIAISAANHRKRKAVDLLLAQQGVGKRSCEVNPHAFYTSQSLSIPQMLSGKTSQIEWTVESFQRDDRDPKESNGCEVALCFKCCECEEEKVHGWVCVTCGHILCEMCLVESVESVEPPPSKVKAQTGHTSRERSLILRRRTL